MDEKYILKEIKKKLAEKRPNKNYDIRTVIKNNSHKEYAVIEPSHDKLSPMVYFTDLYARISDGVMEIDEAVDRILSRCHKVVEMITPEFDISILNNKDAILKNVYLRVVNGTKLNEEYLRSVVHIKPIEGLAAVFVISVSKDESAGVVLTNRMIEGLDLDVSELYQTALKNTMDRKPYMVKTLPSIINYINDNNEVLENEKDIMYVLTNTELHFGATVILYKDVLRKVCEENGFKNKIALIGSSVHEWIIVTDPSPEILNNIRKINQEVNMTLEPKEILSDQILIYDINSDSLRIAKAA